MSTADLILLGASIGLGLIAFTIVGVIIDTIWP